MKTEPLQSLLPGVLRTRPDVCSSTDWLLSLCRVYTSLYDLVATNDLEKEFGRRTEYAERADELLHVLLLKITSTDEPALRSALISATYALICGTTFAAGTKLDDCREQTVRLFYDYADADEPHGLVRTGICRCISDMLCPEIPEGDACFRFFRTSVRKWAGALSAVGCWAGIPFDVALERIEVMNRNSYMFLDRTYDGAVKRAFEYYRQRLTVPRDPGNFDECYLRTLGRLYDVALQGNAYAPDTVLAGRIARFMGDYARMQPERNDEWLYSTSYVVHNLAGEIAGQLQQGGLQHMDGVPVRVVRFGYI